MPAAESKAPLFAPGALDRFASPDRLDIAAAVVRPGTWLLVWGVVVVVIAALIGGLLIEAPYKVRGEGVLLDAAGVKDVSATANGEIREILMRPGDHVGVGSVVARISQPDLAQDLENAKAELADARDELSKTLDLQTRTQTQEAAFRKQKAENLKQSLGFAEQRVATLKDQLASLQPLVDKGIVVKQKLIDVRKELDQANEATATARADLQQLDVEASTRNAERERERLALELKASSAERKLALIQERLGRVAVVTSPYEGVVAEIKMNAGEPIERGGVILSVVPDPVANPADDPVASLSATVYVDPAEGKKIKLGMPVEVMPTTVRREEDGFIKGRVAFVSEVPATLEGMTRVLKNKALVQKLANGVSPFEVRVELQADHTTKSGLAWSSSRGPDLAITSGGLTRAEIIYRSEPVLQLLVPETKPYLEPLRPYLQAVRERIGL